MDLDTMIQRLQAIRETEGNLQNVSTAWIDDGVVLVEHGEDDDE